MKMKKYASLEEMYLGTYKLVFVFARDYSKDWSIAEETASRVWGKIMEHPEAYLEREITYLHNYIRVIVKNEMIQIYREGEREEKLIQMYVDTLNIPLTTEEEFIQQESIDRMREARKRLTEEENRLLELRFERKFSVKETGEAMGISISAVKMRQKRTLERLKKNMESGNVKGGKNERRF